MAENRGDRDKYITIHWNNIRVDRDNYEIADSDLEHGSFDFKSVMLYGSTGELKPDITRKSDGKPIDRNQDISQGDAEAVRELYTKAKPPVAVSQKVEPKAVGNVSLYQGKYRGGNFAWDISVVSRGTLTVNTYKMGDHELFCQNWGECQVVGDPIVKLYKDARITSSTSFALLNSESKTWLEMTLQDK